MLEGHLAPLTHSKLRLRIVVFPCLVWFWLISLRETTRPFPWILGSIVLCWKHFWLRNCEEWDNVWEMYCLSSAVVHTVTQSMTFLRLKFRGRLNLRVRYITWPPCSPDLTAPDFICSQAYAARPPPPPTVPKNKVRFTEGIGTISDALLQRVYRMYGDNLEYLTCKSKVYTSGSQTFSVHRPLGSIYTPTAPPYLF
jgi:hypothetical protein